MDKLTYTIRKRNIAADRAGNARAEAEEAKAWVNHLIELQELVTTLEARKAHGRNLTAAKTAEYTARQRAIKAENHYRTLRYKAEVALGKAARKEA